MNHENLLANIEITLQGTLNVRNENYLRVNIEALMVLFYNEYLDHDDKNKLNSLSKFSAENELGVKSKFDYNQNQSLFIDYISEEKNNFRRRRTSIDYLLNKIDLMEPFKDL